MSQHTYIIPYYKNNNEIYVLIAEKKKYSRKDGFLHNNAGQYILIGGHLEKNMNVVENMIKEFHEETGHNLNYNKVKLLDIDNKYFFVGTYNCNFNEYNTFKDLNEKQYKFRELNNIFWVNLNKVKNILINHNKNINSKILSHEYYDSLRKNLLYMSDKNKYKYIYENDKIDLNKIKKWYPTKELNSLIKKYKKDNKSNKEILNKFLYPRIINNDKKIKNEIIYTLNKYITKNGQYDWFVEGLDSFINIIQNKSPKNIKKSPKKESPKKFKVNKNRFPKNENSKPLQKSRFPKNTKGYVPPHKRNLF